MCYIYILFIWQDELLLLNAIWQASKHNMSLQQLLSVVALLLLLLLLDGAMVLTLEWQARQAWREIHRQHEAYLAEHERHLATKRMLRFLSHEGM